jgi:hypothetical protein
MDREISIYETPKEVVDKVFEDYSTISLVKKDDYFPEDLDNPQYPADFTNRHKNELDEFFESKGLERSELKEIVYKYRDMKNARVLYGSAVYAESNPFDITPYISIQSVGLNGSSPVYIFEPTDLLQDTNKYNLSINGSKNTKIFEGRLSFVQISSMIRRIHMNSSIGKKEFPSQNEDPFLLLARDISSINRRDFSGY